jgi:hypothetical protein
MQRVLSKDLWAEIRKRARAASSRKGAIAYVTRDLVGFRKRDTLVVDASGRAIQNGETDAPLLRKLHKKVVRLYDCPDLHAKVLLLDEVAVIGSGNMSSSSESRMVEAALISDQASVAAGVASLIEQLVRQSSRLDEKRIAQLCRIEVIRRGGWNGARPKSRKTRIAKIGNRAWIVGVYDLKRKRKPEVQKLVDREKHSILRQRPDITDEDLGEIQWPGRGRFVRECREGDLLIQIWRSGYRTKRPSSVFKVVSVVRKQRMKQLTMFYVAQTSGRAPEMKWSRFQRLLREVGHTRPVKAGSVQLIDPDVADAISRQWNYAAKS